MEDTHTSLIARDDTMLGICQGLGEDFGFDPLYLRVALSVSLLWNPAVVFAVYAALGVVVLFSRLLFPNPRMAPAAAAATAAEAPAEVASPAPAPVAAAEDRIGRQLLPLAA